MFFDKLSNKKKYEKPETRDKSAPTSFEGITSMNYIWVFEEQADTSLSSFKWRIAEHASALSSMSAHR